MLGAKARVVAMGFKIGLVALERNLDPSTFQSSVHDTHAHCVPMCIVFMHADGVVLRCIVVAVRASEKQLVGRAMDQLLISA